MAHYKADIVNIELENGNIHRSFLKHSIGLGDVNANRFGIRVFRNGEPVDLTGASCQGFFRNSAGTNIALTSHGTVSGNLAFVTLPQACYNQEGYFTLAIKLVGGGVTGTMRIVDGMVDNTNTGGAVAPTSDIPTYQEVLSVYEQAIASVDKVNDMKSTVYYDGMLEFEQGGIFLADRSPWDTKTRVRTPWKKYGKVMKLSVTEGYEIIIFNRDQYVKLIQTTQLYYAYENAEFAFVVRKSDDTEEISVSEAFENVMIEEAPHNVIETEGGLILEKVELIPDLSMSSLKYTYTEDRAISAPIKIPKSGMRITYNPEKIRAGEAAPFRVLCVKETANGFTLCTDNADLVAENGSTTSTYESVYIPYIEDAYIIILTGSYNSDEDNIKDSIWVYTGESKTAGKLLGLHPVRCYLTDDDPPELQILWGNKNAIINTSGYFGGDMWLKYAKRITVDPKYTIVANIFERTGSGIGDYVLRDCIYIYESGSNAGRIHGVQEIDLTKYNFDGFIRFGIQCSTQYRARGSSTLSYKTMIGMGVMSRYMDVYNSVHVEYKNNYQFMIEPGIQSVLFENINDFCEYTYPLRLESYYVLPTEKATAANKRRFSEMEDASPAFYCGYNGNTVLLNVIGKSYYTAMANVNSRCYQFAWDENSYGNIGYGITCTDFVSIMLGLEENYWTTQMAFGTSPKFERISDNWNYITDMDLLKPGDILTQVEKESNTSIVSHCMIVYEKKYINGQLETITLAEAGYPYTRFTTLYNEKYYPLTGEWEGFRRLSHYKFVNRIRPQYIRRLKDIYDLSKSYVPGTLRCDRGTNSIYSVNPVDGAYPDGEKNLAARKLIVTITDDEATKIRIYKDGTLLETINIGNDTMNDLRIVDIKEYITAGGLYTLKTDNSDDVQETFYVQEPMYFETDDPSAPTGYKRIHAPEVANLKYMEVNYRAKNTVDGEPVYTNEWRLTYAGSEFEEDTSPYDSSWGVLDVPEKMIIPTEFAEDGYAEYNYIILVYGTEYGTFQLRYASRNGTVTPVAISGYGMDG